jgi:chromobox protein 5
VFNHDVPHDRGAKELIAEYWARQGKKKGEKGGRKSDTKPKAATRRPVAASVESTPEPAQATKKRGRDRPRAKSGSDDEVGDEEEDVRSRKRGRKSNGVTRKASPSPASSSDRASPVVDLLEPSAIKKWGNLPSWERHVEAIDTVEKTDDGDLFIYFKLYVVLLSTCTISDNVEILSRKGEKTACKENSRICAERFPQQVRSFATFVLSQFEQGSYFSS